MKKDVFLIVSIHALKSIPESLKKIFKTCIFITMQESKQPSKKAHIAHQSNRPNVSPIAYEKFYAVYLCVLNFVYLGLINVSGA